MSYQEALKLLQSFSEQIADPHARISDLGLVWAGSCISNQFLTKLCVRISSHYLSLLPTPQQE